MVVVKKIFNQAIYFNEINFTNDFYLLILNIGCENIIYTGLFLDDCNKNKVIIDSTNLSSGKYSLKLYRNSFITENKEDAILLLEDFLLVLPNKNCLDILIDNALIDSEGFIVDENSILIE